jgi:hypothetical protein
MNWRLFIATVLLALWAGSSAGHAACQTTNLAKQGVWEAFGGPCDSGKAKCGMATKGPGKYFSVNYFQGDPSMQIQLGASDWRLRDGTKMKVVIEVDRKGPWQANGTAFHFSDGDAGLWFNIQKDQIPQFIMEIRNGNRMVVRFPDGDMADWNGGMSGSDSVADAFLNCIRAM